MYWQIKQGFVHRSYPWPFIKTLFCDSYLAKLVYRNFFDLTLFSPYPSPLLLCSYKLLFIILSEIFTSFLLSHRKMLIHCQLCEFLIMSDPIDCFRCREFWIFPEIILVIFLNFPMNVCFTIFYTFYWLMPIAEVSYLTDYPHSYFQLDGETWRKIKYRWMRLMTM